MSSEPPDSSIPPPARYDHGSGDCPMHGDNVPFRAPHKSGTPKRCVACEQAGDWLDPEGYPTDVALEHIAKWPMHSRGDMAELLERVWTIWWMPAWGFHVEGDRYSLSTGGWSGNESIIEALQRNTLFWSVCWQSHRRGGHFVFELPEWTE